MLQRFLTVIAVSVLVSSCTLAQAVRTVDKLGDLGEQLLAEDVAATKTHRELRADAIEDAFEVCLERVEDMGNDPWVDVKAAIDGCIALLDDNHPKLTIERYFELKGRLRELKEPD